MKENLIKNSLFIKSISLIFIVIVFSAFFYPNLFSITPKYKEGDVIEKDIKASKDFYYERIDKTNALKEEANKNSLPVYSYNKNFGNSLINKISVFFEKSREFVTKEQLMIKSLSKEKKAHAIISFKNKMWKRKEQFEKTINTTIDNVLYQGFIKSNFSIEVVNFINHILKTILANGIVENKEEIIKLEGKGLILIDDNGKEEKIVFGLKRFYSNEQIKPMVTIIGEPISKKKKIQNVDLIVNFIKNLLEPNIKFNPNKTSLRKEANIARVKPVLNKVRKGEMIVREGSLISQEQIFKIKGLYADSKKEKVYISSLGFMLLLIFCLYIMYFLHFKQKNQSVKKHNKNILFITSVLIFSLLISKSFVLILKSLSSVLPSFLSAYPLFYAAPIASGAILVCLFFDLTMAIYFSIILSIFTSIIFGGNIELFIYFFFNSTLAAYWLRDCKERQVFVKAGLKIALLNIVLAFIINLYLARDLTATSFAFSFTMAFMGGFTSGLIAAGFTPLVELVFGYTTDIKLLELANLDQPILRKLMIEVPGTYNHSMLVGMMAEAAASAIGANFLRAKVCGYYHDIGKMKKALYFIENQSNGKNKHDKLSPSMSALILISHVKAGLEIAKKNKLGQDIMDAISQHHGTSTIKFFYDKAKKKDENTKKENYKYLGPKPQTREVGIVMLADVVEAASRTLTDPTPNRLTVLVQNMVNNIFLEGELSECELTLKDLNAIVKSFSSILSGIYHHRVEYPAS